MKLRILSEPDVRSVITMAEAIDIQEDAFMLLANRETVEGLRSYVLSDEPPGVAIFNPSFVRKGKGYGIKVVSDFYENGRHGVPRMNAIVVLFDGVTGQPRTVMEAGFLTDLRTGAGTGLAARHLARPDCRSIAVIGAGRVARNQLEALSEVVDLEMVWVATRSEERGRSFVERMRKVGGRVPADVRLTASREEAVSEADIVVAATTAQEPVFPGERLKPGTFVVAAGAHAPTAREVDSVTIGRASKWVIDSRRDCLDDAGDLLIPIGEGILKREQVAEIAEIVAGTRPGRETSEEITYYKSIGVPIQDLVTAQRIERNAIDRGIGTVLEIGGDED